MNISAPFIRRPIATALLMLGLLAAGLVAYPLMPVAALPNVNYPTLTITAQLPGADPQTMASSVASPLELQFGEIPGLAQMTSASALGYTQITLQFDLSRQIDGAVSDTLSAINAASPYLPVGMPYPPTIRKVNPADTPILVLGITSDSLPLTTVDAYAENILLQKISQISGVGLVGIGGQQKAAVRIQSTSPRERSTAHDRPTPSTPTIRSSTRINMPIWSSPIATDRRSACATSDALSAHPKMT
jgi:HAE1 family hydrophobic/amphiphilic exporter-1